MGDIPPADPLIKHEELAKRFNEICREVQTLRAVVANDSENEARARILACQVLPEKLVYGDRYGVPTIDEIVERLVSVRVACYKAGMDDPPSKAGGIVAETQDIYGNRE